MSRLLIHSYHLSWLTPVWQLILEAGRVAGLGWCQLCCPLAICHLASWSLSLLFHEMGIMWPGSQGYCENEWRRWHKGGLENGIGEWRWVPEKARPAGLVHRRLDFKRSLPEPRGGFGRPAQVEEMGKRQKTTSYTGKQESEDVHNSVHSFIKLLFESLPYKQYKQDSDTDIYSL